MTHTRVTGLIRDPAGAIVGVRVADGLTNQSRVLHARRVVNATGPWLDELLDLIDPGHSRLLRRTKGVHLVTPRVTSDAVVLFAQTDERLFFVVPWLGYSFIGTTDTDFEGDPGQARADQDDVAYLLREVAEVFPGIAWESVYATTAGVRALARQEGVGASAVSRRHQIVDHAGQGAPGLLSVVGGKLTAYRGIAEEVVDRVAASLAIVAPSRTRERPLPGAVGYGPDLLAIARRTGGRLGLDDEQTAQLVAIYGGRYHEIFDLIARQPRLARRLAPAVAECLAQLHHAVQREGARTLTDVLLRRLTLGLRPSQALAGLAEAAAEVGQVLGWDTARVVAEMATYRSALDALRPPADRRDDKLVRQTAAGR